MKTQATIAASAARTTTGSITFSSDRTGAVFTLDITAASGTTPTLDVKIQRFDTTSGKYVDLPSASFAQKTGTGTDDLVVYPGVAETANRSVSDVLAKNMKAVWTLGGTTPNFTFSLGVVFID